jgi:hypothetical protein
MANVAGGGGTLLNQLVNQFTEMNYLIKNYWTSDWD